MILWIPVYASSVEQTALWKYQSVHPPDRPIGRMSKADRAEAWVNACKKIEKALTPPAAH